MKDAIASTQNMISGFASVDSAYGQSQFGSVILWKGPTGTGKTSVAELAINKWGGWYWRARQVSTIRSMLSELLTALGGCHLDYLHQRTASLYERLRNQLLEVRPALLAVDESDYLVRRIAHHDMLNVLRDLADDTGAIIIFISVTQLAQHLATPGPFLETISSRVCAQVEFKRPSLADAEILARELLEGVKFDRDLISFCLRASAGSIRPLLRLYAEIERGAKWAGLSGSLSLAKCAALGLGKVSPAASAAKAVEVPEKLTAPSNTAPAKVRAA